MELLAIPHFIQVKSAGTSVISTIKALLRHCWSVKFALLVPITLYNALAMSFVYAELTRSLTSCAVGVQWVSVYSDFWEKKKII